MAADPKEEVTLVLPIIAAAAKTAAEIQAVPGVKEAEAAAIAEVEAEAESVALGLVARVVAAVKGWFAPTPAK